MKRLCIILLLAFVTFMTMDAREKVRNKEKRDTIASSVITGLRSRSAVMGHSHIPEKMFQARAVMSTSDLIKTLQPFRVSLPALR